jgi:hypothetical protein
VVTLHYKGVCTTRRGYEGITVTGHQLLAVNLKLSSEDPVPVNVAMLSQSPYEYDKEQLTSFWNCIFTSADGLRLEVANSHSCYI